MVSLTTSKILTMLLTGLVPIFLGLIPMKAAGRLIHSDNVRHQSIVSCLLCFGGGILMATSMIHMLPEVRENLEKALPDSFEGLAETLLCVGFFLIYFVEELVHFACDQSLQHDHCPDDHTQSISVHKTFSMRPDQCDAGRACVQPCGLEGCSAVSESQPIYSNDTRAYDSIEEEQQPVSTNNNHGSSSDATSITQVLATSSNYNTFSNQSGHHHDNRQRYPMTSNEPLESQPVTSQGGVHTSTVRDFLTVLALSFHAVFEGLAVGLEDNVTNVWTLYLAVSMHKYVISFCVGLELFTKNQNPFKVNLSYILVYAVMSPLGIAIGIAVTSLITPDNSTYFVTVGVLQAIAGGTILYVVVFEVLQREKSKQKVPGLMQFIFVILGFTTMFLVEKFGPSD